MYFLSKACEIRDYGRSRCEQMCSPFCTFGLCHHVTGECENGCIDGRQGPQCLEGMDNCVLYYSQWL